MPAAEFIFFTIASAWRVARVDGDAVAWLDWPGPDDAAALEAFGYDGRPAVLAVASDDCLAARVSTGGLPRGDRRALTFRFEERLPLAAEDVVADFGPRTATGDVLAVCVATATVAPRLRELTSAGVAVRSIVPAALVATQRAAAAFGEEDGVWLLAEPTDATGTAMLSAVTLQAGRPIDWALLPATAADVSLHVRLLTAQLGLSPTVHTMGLDDLQIDEFSESLACVVHAEPGRPADAAAVHGAGVSGGRGTTWVELARDALAASDRLLAFRGLLNAALAAVAMLLLSLTVVLGLRAAAYTRAATEDKARLVAEFRQRFPDWTVPANVRAVIAAEHRKAANVTTATAVGTSYGSAPATLRDLLAALPEDGRFALDSVSVQDDSVTLAGRLSSFELVDAIAAAVRKTGMDVPPPQTRRAAGGLWAFSLQGTRPGERGQNGVATR